RENDLVQRAIVDGRDGQVRIRVNGALVGSSRVIGRVEDAAQSISRTRTDQNFSRQSLPQSDSDVASYLSVIVYVGQLQDALVLLRVCRDFHLVDGNVAKLGIGFMVVRVVFNLPTFTVASNVRLHERLAAQSGEDANTVDEAAYLIPTRRKFVRITDRGYNSLARQLHGVHSLELLASLSRRLPARQTSAECPNVALACGIANKASDDSHLMNIPK